MVAVDEWLCVLDSVVLGVAVFTYLLLELLMTICYHDPIVYEFCISNFDSFFSVSFSILVLYSSNC